MLLPKSIQINKDVYLSIYINMTYIYIYTLYIFTYFNYTYISHLTFCFLTSKIMDRWILDRISEVGTNPGHTIRPRKSRARKRARSFAGGSWLGLGLRVGELVIGKVGKLRG